MFSVGLVITNPRSLITFCETSLDPAAMDALIKKGKAVGLKDPKLEENLTNGDYQAVLTALWSDRDRPSRLAWLRTKADGLHPVLMFELGMAEYGAAPTAVTVNTIVAPLFQAAGFRIRQDAQCSSDSSVGDAEHRMKMVYMARLNAKIRTVDPTNDLSKVLSADREARIAAIRARVLATIRSSKLVALPSPLWVGWHGIGALTSDPPMHPPAQFKPLRDAFADASLAQIRDR